VLRRLFADAAVLRGCRTFPLLHRFLAKSRRLRASHEALDDEVARLRARLSQLSGEGDEKMVRIRRQSLNYAANSELEATVREGARRLATRLELVAACVSLLVVPNDRVAGFEVSISALGSLGDDIGRIVANLQSAGPAQVMPPAVRKAMNLREQWIEAVMQIQQLARSFRVDSGAVDQCALSVADVAEALAKA
jgi:hypothetical protein